MSAVSNVLAGAPGPTFAPSPNAPSPSGPLGPAPPPPPAPTFVDADYAPPEPDALELDPYVMETPVKIRVLGSSRMLARPILAQQFQFLAPLMLNGPVLEQLALQGETFDMVEFFRLAQDATGLGKTYHFLKPLSEEQKQARSQPPPAVQAQIQKAQLDNQGRQQAVQTKAQTDAQRLQVEAMLKQKQIDAEDARHLLTLAHQEKQAREANQQPQHQALLDVLKGKQALQQSQAESHAKLQTQAQSNQQKLTFAAQQQALKLRQQALDHAQSLRQAHQSHLQETSHQARSHQQESQHTQHTQALEQAGNRQNLQHQILMNLMARQQKEHEVEQARKAAAAKPQVSPKK